MRKLLFIPAILLFLLAAPPAWSFDLGADGNFSVGLGAGFGDNQIGPGVLSGKYWGDWFEVGAEIFYAGDKGDDVDQLGMGWLLYRYNLHVEENNTPWLGVGFGKIAAHDSYQDSFGFMAAMGWEGRGWGLEFKYGYYDPSLYSFVAYYQVN